MVSFESLANLKKIYLYAGDLSDALVKQSDNKFTGLSLTQNDNNHIQFDIRNQLPLQENSVDIFCAEDVMEHIDYKLQINIFNEVHRILKPNGIFRLAVPDYRCDILFQRTLKTKKGELKFDPGGGGSYNQFRRKVVGGGHIWFPNYQNVRNIFDKSNFEDKKVNFLHYYVDFNDFVLKDIDYSICHIARTPDNDSRVADPRRPMSIVVDATK
jgi:SAM-dependent methyltransferase